MQDFDVNVHELKCWPEAFEPMFKGIKNFEFRRNDRDFKIGDVLHLREWNPFKNGGGDYTGRDMFVRVEWILYKGFGLPEGYCIMSTYKITPAHATWLEFGDIDDG